ncbi:c-type cytochrome [Verrucomicrobiales bacterium BCK34]|nr:c-type cytochrome [Verrucomicrobiales bacterium BCK34]
MEIRDMLSGFKSAPETLLLLLCVVLGAPVAVDSEESDEGRRQELHQYLKGRYLFQKHCTTCHGETGRGDGPWAADLKDKPRNFRVGVFKFRTTPFGKLPVEADLRRTIRGGISGTAMPFFKDLTDEDIGAIIVYLQNLSRKWDEEELKAKPIELAPRPEWYGDVDAKKLRVKKGKALFAVNCVSCHGEKGKGDGPAGVGLVDLWEHPIVPADLSGPHHKSGDTPEDIFRTIATGLNGTPMIGFHDILDAESIWELVAFIQSLPADD